MIWMEKIKKIKSFFTYVVLSLLIGMVSGVVGAFFHLLIEKVSVIREGNSFIIYFLPLAAVVITLIYKISSEKLSTDTVLLGIRSNKDISPLLAPFIFVATIISHLVGASVGREGAALQIGGGIGNNIGRVLKAEHEDKSFFTVLGMAGAFSAIFTTPVTAVIFAIEVLSVGHMRYFEIFFCMLSSLVAFGISILMGNHQIGFPDVLDMPFDLDTVIKTIIIAIAAGFCARLFCLIINEVKKWAKKFIKNDLLRAFCLGVLLLIFTLLLGTRIYNGAGMDTIGLCLSGNTEEILMFMTKTALFAFLIKMIMTAVSIAAGLKGGEIVPAFFIGTTLGVLLSMLLGLDLSFGASLGMLVLFCGITNCPIATLILGIELFGGGNILYFALAIGLGFIVSGKRGLYREQRIVYSKFGIEKND